MAPKGSTVRKSILVAEVLEALELARKKLGMSREDFMSKGRVSSQTWLYWQNGDTTPNLTTLEKLLRAHHLHLAIIAEGEGDVYSEETRLVANMVEAMPREMRQLVRVYVMEIVTKALASSRPPAALPPPEDKK
jgi:transcriptional regulator with XRE-family HTH domain